jgi:hypothetical protein
MTKNITKIDNPGLFDSIRHLDDDGNEYWFARELMPLLGYVQWRRFEGVIDRVTACLDNIGAVKGANVSLLPGLARLSDKGADDYKLSRLACYLVAINGDPRKPKIAAAQAYFVTKAREAELGQQNQQPLKPETVNIYDLNHSQIERLKIVAELREDFDASIVDREFLADIDPTLWDMPYELAEHLSTYYEYRECKALDGFQQRNKQALADSSIPFGFLSETTKQVSTFETVLRESFAIAKAFQVQKGQKPMMPVFANRGTGFGKK